MPADTARDLPGIHRFSWACPDHGLPLTADDVWTCPNGCTFVVVDGISRFIPPSSYSDNFGLQWNRWRSTQLDSSSGSPISRDRLRASLGAALFDDLAGMRVLEVGCGAGRFTEVLVDEGATVVSVDLSSAVDANAANVPVSDQHVIAQADVVRLPLAPGQFDLVLALGMVQHTPDPDETVRRLCEQAGPGGWLVIDHYASGLVHEVRAARWYRSRMTRMPVTEAMALTERLYETWAPRHERARSWAARKALVLASPIVYFGDGWPQLSAEQRREWSILDTYDSLTDVYKFRRSPEQIGRLFDTLPLTDVTVGMEGHVVVARGRRADDQGPDASSSASSSR
jgi:2-polyprenyl-3-methyl-5-hydroxy-6-metoxy-1,4-benzoquinol methylase